MGRSTVSKYLPALEKDGAALRTPGGREGRRRLPDHWQAAPTTSTEQDPPAHEVTSTTVDLDGTDIAPPPTVETTGPEQTDPEATSTDTGATAPQLPVEAPVPGPVTDALPAPGASTRPAEAAPAPSAPAPRASAVSGQETVSSGGDEQALNPVSGSRRLAPGELKIMVWALLKADPEEEFTATELHHVLQGRSIGAIQNNLAKLTKEGKAELVCDKPRRYRFATSAH